MKKKLILFVVFGLFMSVEGVMAQGLKIAYVSSDSVLLSLNEYKTQLKIYESYGKQLNSQMESKQKELQAKLADFQQNRDNWIPEVVQDKQKELQQLDKSLQEFAQQAQVNLARKEQELMAPLYEKIQTGIDDVAKELGYDFVLQKQVFLFAKPDYDITLSVIKKLGGTPGTAATE